MIKELVVILTPQLMSIMFLINLYTVFPIITNDIQIQNQRKDTIIK
jgi:hypothetical protein